MNRMFTLEHGRCVIPRRTRFDSCTLDRSRHTLFIKAASSPLGRRPEAPHWHLNIIDSTVAA